MAADDSDCRLPSRRDVLKKLGAATVASLVVAPGSPSSHAAEAPATPFSPKPDGASAARHTLHGIDPKKLTEEYERRGLDELGDAELCRQAAGIIGRPPAKGNSSFTLHAPLELLARYGLMPLVDPRERKRARLQLVGSAANFESQTTAGPDSSKAGPMRVGPFPDPATAKKEFINAFQHGQADALEAIVLQFAAQYGTTNLVQVLTPLALPTLSGASHSHIGLWLLLRHARTSDVADAGLLRAAARALAADPKGQLRSFSGMTIEGTKPLSQSPADVEREILEKFAAPTRTQGSPGGMRGLFTAGEATGNADALFTDFIRHDLSHEQIDAAFRASLRVCAHNMLQHGPEHAKFGWSHNLTLPQAACGLSSLEMDRKLALASTLVWVTSYRSVLSDHDLDYAWTPPKLNDAPSLMEALQTSPTAAAGRVWYADDAELPEIKQTLATQASIRTDQHLIKYTRACLDMISFDPQHERLYLAAAAHLCAIWVKERPKVTIA